MTYPGPALYPGAALYPSAPAVVAPPTPLPPVEPQGSARWAWAVGPWQGLPSRQLASATQRSCKLRLVGTSEASFTLDGTTDEATRVRELVSDLWVMRNGVTLYRGRVGGTTDTLDGTRHTVAVSTGDYRALLARRLLFDGDALSYTNVEQAAVAWGLVSTTLGHSGGGLNIANGATTASTVTGQYTPPETQAAQLILARLNSGGSVFEDFSWPGCPQIVSEYNDDLSKQFFAQNTTATWPGASDQAKTWLQNYITSNPTYTTQLQSTPYTGGVTRTITYPAGQSVGQAIEALSLMDSGFNWDVVPNTGQMAQVFTVWPSRGESRSTVLDYPGRIASLTRTVDPGQYANSIRETGDATVAAVTAAAPDIAVRDEGRWDAQLGDTALKDAGSVTARANYDLAQRQTITPAYAVKLYPGAWGGPLDVWLGDVVTLSVQSGRLAVNEPLRVWEVDIDLDEADTETVTLTLSGLDPFKRARARQVDQRLTALERR